MQPARLGAWSWCRVAGALLAILGLAPHSHAQTILETPQQTNDRIRSRSTLVARSAPHDYLIGSGDVLSIQVFEIPELSRDVRVSQSGTIGIPLVPVRLRMSGLTEAQAEQKIAEVLEADGLVTHPQVSVSVKERKSKPITIVGAVSHPLVYQAERPITLVEALAEAGGIANDAGDTVIVTRSDQPAESESSDPTAISRGEVIPGSKAPGQENSAAGLTAGKPAAGNSPAQVSAASPNTAAAGVPTPETASPNTLPISNVITVNLNELLETGNPANNILLQGGDIVAVPHAGIVYVLGAVGKPGGFVVSSDRTQLTTLKVLSLAGGMTRTAKSDRAVIIRKDTQGQQHEVAVDLNKVLKRATEDVQLQPSDILYVPESATKQAMVRAAELGVAIGTAAAIFRIAKY
ncbi:MAG TPA: polysaccharide biosynthesis/export family protein [Candidatus Acidoferrum sp.]|jgi:polysaccharide export outer membrane protein|nr:polysaccharide biosynthesis/export family protein [Candidatus Acidoferrum sp.]